MATAVEPQPRPRLTRGQVDELGRLLLPWPHGTSAGLRVILAGQWFLLIGVVARAVWFGRELSAPARCLVVVASAAFAAYLCSLTWAYHRRRGVALLDRYSLVQAVAQVGFLTACLAAAPVYFALMPVFVMPVVLLGTAHETLGRRRQRWALAAIAAVCLWAASWVTAREWAVERGTCGPDALASAVVGLASVLVASWWALRRPYWRRDLVGLVLGLLDLPECGFDVITEAHKVLWLNRVQRERFPGVAPGATCHVAFKQEDVPCDPCPMEGAVRTGAPGGRATQPEAVDGRMYHVSAAALPGCTGDGVAAAFETVVDVTDVHRRQVEAWLREQAARRALRDLLRKMLSHEAFGRFDGIRGLVSRLETLGLPVEALPLLDSIRLAVDDAMHQVLRLRDPGDVRVSLEDLDLGSMVRQALNGKGTRLAERNISVACELEEGILRARADPRWLRALVEELLENAARFAPRASKLVVSGTVDAEEGMVVLRVGQEPHWR